MLVGFHVDAFAAEFHAFHFQAHALLLGGFELQLDFAAGTDYPLPGQAGVGAPQQLRHVPMI